MSLMEEVNARLQAAAERAAADGAESDDTDMDVETEDTGDEPDAGAGEEMPEEAAADSAADAAQVAEYCSVNDCASLAAPLIREKATMEQVKARVNAAGTIRAMVADAGKINEKITAELAGQYIADGLSVEQVRAKLWDSVVAAQSEEIRGAISADTAISATSWSKAVDKVNARIQGEQPKEG